MKLTHLTIAVICTFIFTMCTQSKDKQSNNKSEREEGVIEINFDKVEPQKFLYSSLFDSVEFVALETTDESLLGGRGSKSIFCNDTLYISSGSSIRLFTMKGKYIRSIGKPGHGPGEFINISKYTVSPISNIIQILKDNKVVTYSKSGDFIKEVKIDKDIMDVDIAFQEDTTYISNMVSNQGFNTNTYYMHQINSNGNVTKEYFTAEEYALGYNKSSSLGDNFTYCDNSIRFCKTFFDTIFSIENSIIKPYIVLKSNNWVTRSEIQHAIRTNKNTSPSNVTREDKFIGAYYYSEGDNIISFRTGSMNRRCFYYKDSGEVIWSKSLQGADDVTYFNPYLGSVYKDKMIVVNSYRQRDIDGFISSYKEGNLKITEAEYKSLCDLDINSNGYMLIYHFRDSYKKIVE